MADPEAHERIAARRAELDELEERLAKQLAEVRPERDELGVAERVWQRMREQVAQERASARHQPEHTAKRSHQTTDQQLQVSGASWMSGLSGEGGGGEADGVRLLLG
ncbi:hypothetical protein [Streptomyces sp. ISL-11]|uniref:hypothetical protein n=1 Tax=Streptomyces sp. ISL-11 TaxID=2819174 RepID=UPI001BE744AE|nr:hypothetical protein [Streptomyces sp. ISL-11]MBT2386631.1 hypothetical protein [Streptomyces sp. ISL-11]